MMGEGLLKIKSNGRDYAGKFKDGKLLYGEMQSAEGVYLGQFKSLGGNNYAHHGMGIMRFINGDVYEGNWKDDHMHGEGNMKYAKTEEDDGRHGRRVKGENCGDGRSQYSRQEISRCKRIPAP